MRERVGEVNDYTCDCDEDYELMLLVNGAVCVAKECEIFRSNTVQWNRRDGERESETMPCSEDVLSECTSVDQGSAM